MPVRRSNRISNKTIESDEILILEDNELSSKKVSKQKKKQRKNRKRKSQLVSSSISKRSRNTTRAATGASQTRPHSRPVTISLDVTYSESDDSSTEDFQDESASHLQEPVFSVQNSRISSPSTMTRLSTYASSDSEIETFETKYIVPPNPLPVLSDSDSDNDLYGTHYLEERHKVYEKVKSDFSGMKFKNIHREDSPSGIYSCSSLASNMKTQVPVQNKANMLCSPMDRPELKKTLDDSLDLNLENIDVSSVVLRGSKGKARRSKTTKQAIASLRAFSQRIQKKQEASASDSWNEDDYVIIADSPTSSGIPIKVRWGMEYSRHTVKKDFVSVYQDIANEHKVSVSQVVLSFKDVLISPSTHPHDIGVSIGDIIDGGILSETASGTSSNSQSVSGTSKDMISLKVQTSNRKIVHTLQLCKYDKLSVLMEGYAKLRDIPLDRLKFMFDGETMQPNDTPSSLDLDGGECLDVFEK